MEFFLFVKIDLYFKDFDNDEKSKTFIIFDFKFYSVKIA